MANIRQSILIRKDLVFPVGLLAAQVAHLHMEYFRRAMIESKENKDQIQLAPIEKSWLLDPYVFVHGVPNTEVLNFFIEEAKKMNVLVSEWRDTVYVDISDTQRKAFPNVRIGVTLGPDDSDKIKAVIGDLPLL